MNIQKIDNPMLSYISTVLQDKTIIISHIHILKLLYYSSIIKLYLTWFNIVQPPKQLTPQHQEVPLHLHLHLLTPTRWSLQKKNTKHTNNKQERVI